MFVAVALAHYVQFADETIHAKLDAMSSVGQEREGEESLCQVSGARQRR